ncbi:MAG TPA: magnesium chelatase, partial [Chitinophagaceae bacterium]|nr:magnesium chelatase [Chitinophagaceae bacterium]
MDENLFEPGQEVHELNEVLNTVKDEMAKAIVGQHELVEMLLVGLLCDGHILIEGVPGVAKTLAAKLIAKTIDADFSRIQFTPDLMPSDVIGTTV